jgi:hypothetical protein
MTIRVPRLISVLLPVVFGLVSSAFADCPALPSAELANYDKAFYKYAITSTDPSLWVKYFVSIGCHDQREAAQRLFYSIVSVPADANLLWTQDEKPATPLPVFAPTAIQLAGQYAGDQHGTVVTAKNNELLSHQKAGGIDLNHFSLESAVRVRDVPMAFTPAAPDDDKDLILWIEYQCAVTGQPYGPFLGVNGKPGGQCDAGPYTFDRINFVLKGRFARFFTLQTYCNRDLHKNSACDNSFNTDKIEDVLIDLVPTHTFRSLLLDNQM